MTTKIQAPGRTGGTLPPLVGLATRPPRTAAIMYHLSACFLFLWLLVAVAAASPAATPGQRAEFSTPGNGANLGVWRITHDPTKRHWANYHNTRSWSHDGRYLCYTRYGEGKTGDEVRVYDAQTDSTRSLGSGLYPRWGNAHNWLFFLRLSHEGPERQLGSEVFWVDLDGGQTRSLAKEPGELDRFGETDAGDQWLYAGRLLRNKRRVDGKVEGSTERSAVRIRIAEASGVEDLPGVKGYQFMTNPRHPLMFTRWRAGPGGDFGSSRLWYDLDGRNERIGIPILQNAHTSWLGNGEYHLMGNGLVRGRRWDEPFPSNVHILAGVQVGDISPCGVSGRYVTGDNWIADLRSGDGWHSLDPLSVICFPEEVGDASTTYDADSKGSPDGTKVSFVSNYDLQAGPVTFLTAGIPAEDGSLQVQSTRGFPAQGSVVIKSEVIGYARLTPTSFEGLTRELYATARAPARAGQAVTSFEARLLDDAQWRRLGRPAQEMRTLIRVADSPLLRQRQTDVYVAVVRRPDRPLLRQRGDAVELIPGEEHRETLGYHLLRDGQRVTRELLLPEARFPLAAGAEYRAIAVERSGLESEPSPALRVAPATSLHVRRASPPDFSWTSDRWLVEARPVPAEVAHQAPAAMREIVHAHDGVIAREWYLHGALSRRHDLNRDGRPTRQLAYRDGKIATRDYVRPEGQLISREVFEPGGFIIETITYDLNAGGEKDHWWWERGMPVRQLKDGREFGRVGDKWIAEKAGTPATKKKRPGKSE